MNGPRIREVGDSALLLELEAVIDPRVNARAIQVATAVRAAVIPGVRDVCPTYRSVAVHFDPLITDLARLHSALTAALDGPAPVRDRPPIAVPVWYGGPDLSDVAAFSGLSERQVIERHAGRPYRVYMLGFLPGFAYMGRVAAAIAMPRHPAPRLRVPAGSVGIAGSQTGIYPRQSPGGWRIIGRTPLRVFDVARTPPALFAPGDIVRFVPTEDREFAAPADGTEPASVSSPNARGHAVTVLHPGLLTTVQDSGRWGHHSIGVSVSGAMDPVSHRLANAIVGNPRTAATLEATLVGPELRFESAGAIAVTGADLGATLDEAPIPMNAAVPCRAGGVLRFTGKRAGGRAYVACAGGVGVPPVLGSRSTHVAGGVGGISGRALRSGDRLPLDRAPADPALLAAPPSARASVGALPSGGARLRVLPGPQDEHFPPEALALLQRLRFTVAPQSDRMGYRLEAERPIPRRPDLEMISDAAFVGGIQVPPSGQPILLMADRQTVGGYPQIAIVITADLAIAGQLVPGDWIEFELCSRREALSALVALEGKLLAMG